MLNRPSGAKETKNLSTMLLLLGGFALIAQAKTAVPVFLLAGQSNMSGYASANDLTADQKKTVDNAKIYVDMTWENNGKLKKWLTLGPGFGSSASNIGPELYIGRSLSDKMPDLKIALIKVCCGSTYLGNYTSKASDCWVPPSSNNGKAGPHYTRMLSAVQTALNSFNSAFDTTQYTPRWAGFVWLQGEFDGQVKALADAYEANLACLINDVRKDLKIDDLPVIIDMIDVQNSWQYNSIIRAAEVAVTKKLKNVDTVDTKGCATDGTHYKAQGQVKIGTNTIDRWLAMKYDYGLIVQIANHFSPSEDLKYELRAAPRSSAIVFDMSGRRIRPSNGSFENMPFGLFIASDNQLQPQQRGQKILMGW
jgi:hypothetical protein